MIEGPVEGNRIPQENRVGTIEVPHFLDHVNALGRVQYFEENSRAFQPEIQQSEIDVVKTAVPRLQEVQCALLPLQPHPHLGQLPARAAPLAITAKVNILQLAQELFRSLNIAAAP